MVVTGPWRSSGPAGHTVFVQTGMPSGIKEDIINDTEQADTGAGLGSSGYVVGPLVRYLSVFFLKVRVLLSCTHPASTS